METIFTLFVLIVALIGLVGVRKENEALEVKRTQFKQKLEIAEECISDNWKVIWDYLKELCDQDDEIKALKLSKRSLKGANTKHKATIEELEDNLIHQKEMDKKVDLAIKKHQEQAKTIKSLNCAIDESKPMSEKLLTMVKKGNMEEAKALVKEFYQM